MRPTKSWRVIKTRQNLIRSLAVLMQLWRFMRPYKAVLVGAGIALVFTAGITLSRGQGVRLLVDEGFIAQSQEALGHAVITVMVLACLMAMGAFTRFLPGLLVGGASHRRYPQSGIFTPDSFTPELF